MYVQVYKLTKHKRSFFKQICIQTQTFQLIFYAHFFEPIYILMYYKHSIAD